jgi:hypothetical protein
MRDTIEARRPRWEMICLLDFEFIRRSFELVVTNAADLPAHVQQRINPALADTSAPDYAGVLEKGAGWLFANWKTAQPEAFDALMAQQPSLAYAESLLPDPVFQRKAWRHVGLVRLARGCFRFHPDYEGSALEQGNAQHPCTERYRSLPEPIARAYYGRVLGFEIVHKLPMMPTESRVLPAHMSAWHLADKICESSRKARANMTAALRSVAADSASSDELINRFFVVLDTREQDDYSKRGAFLLVDELSDRQRIFFVRDGDFLTFGELESPVNVVDRYVANVLRGSSTPFDFSPHVRH